MKIYENRNKKKRKTLCSYCGGQGHLWMACPHPKIHIEQIKRKEPVDITIFTGNHALWATKSKDDEGNLQPRTKWLNNNATEFYNKQLKRVKKNKNNKLRRRCGFCSSPSHNRRNCKVVKTFVQDLTLANQNYRREFYEVFVKQLGIAEGALVELRSGRDNGGRLERSLGLIQHIDWDSINLTLDQPNKNWEYASTFDVWVVVDGKTIKGSTPFQYWLHSDYDPNYPINLRPLIQPLGSYNDNFQILSILSQSSNKPSENWFLEGYDNGWEWLCKNKTLVEIGPIFSDLVEKWHPDNSSKKLQSRLKRYRK